MHCEEFCKDKTWYNSDFYITLAVEIGNVACWIPVAIREIAQRRQSWRSQQVWMCCLPACLEPRKPRMGMWGLEAHPWCEHISCANLLLPSLCRHPAIVSITSVSQNVQSTAILLFSSILLMCSIFLYAKYVEAINTLTCRRCAAREICPFGWLSPFPASPARRTSAGAWIPWHARGVGSARARVAAWAPCHPLQVPGAAQPVPSPWLETYWSVLLPRLGSLIPLETASICLSCSAHNHCMRWQCIYSGIVTTSVRHVFTCTSKCLMERPAQSAWRSEAVDLANISDQCRTLQYSNMDQSV